jgi:nitroimidazol reductase NimA-like FMN-containing flavoprotein (pyridoxamine 5'-phosphate oxidase superfamily)
MAKLDLSMTPRELEAYLEAGRTVRLATVGPDDRPHVVPLWFVWLDGVAYLNSTRGNLTLRNLERNPVATGSIDDGDAYEELRGVLLSGPVQEAGDDPRVEEVARRWSQKYLGGNPVPYGRWRNRVWLRLRPDRVTSWDFRKIPEARARARASRAPEG